MPRIVKETLDNYRVGVRKLDAPEIDPRDGQVLHDGHGLPKMRPITVLGFIALDGTHVVEVPLDEEGRQNVIEMLTGGITIPGIEVAR